jgi:hypothetical protein
LPLRSVRSNRFSSGLPKTGQDANGRFRSGIPPSNASFVAMQNLWSVGIRTE